MSLPTAATFQADEHLATHLLGLGFTETTDNDYQRQLGARSSHHPARGLRCWLAEGKIILGAGAHWRFEAHSQVLAETLAFLLATEAVPSATPTASRPCPLPALGYQHSTRQQPTVPASSLSLTLATDQVLAVALNLNTIADQRLLATIAFEQARGAQAAEIENRTYHLGTKPTAGLGYDDRLTTRLKCCSKTAYTYLEMPVARGGLAHRRLGNRYHITERDVRRFEGEHLLKH